MARMPVAFVAHGAPTLAADPVKGAPLREWARSLPEPSAVLVVSAHWSGSPVAIGSEVSRDLIYDFYGFPPELYRLRYPAPGAPQLAAAVEERLRAAEVACRREPSRGLDHGAWVPLLHMYPDAAVPVIQLSQPDGAEPEAYYRLGAALADLRDEGVLVLCSGVLVHNLRTVDFSERSGPPAWAVAFDRWCRDTLERCDVDALLDAPRQAPEFRRAHPTPEHFTPLLVAAGAAGVRGASVRFPVEGFEYGSLSRRCVQFD